MATMTDNNCNIDVGNEQNPNTFERNSFMTEEVTLALREFLYILYRQSISETTNDKDEFTVNVLYKQLLSRLQTNDKVYVYGGLEEYLYDIVSTVPPELDLYSRGLVMDAVVQFILFLYCKRLAAATGYKKNDNTSYSINPNNTINSIFDDGTQYDSLIERRTNSGDTVDNVKIAGNSEHLFNILFSIIQEECGMYNDLTESKKEKLKKVLDPKIPLLKHDGSPKNTESRYLEIVGDDKYSEFINIIKKCSEKIETLIKNDTEILYKILLPNASDITTKIFAIGDGSRTNGLFGIDNLGVILFPYEFDDKTPKYQRTIDDISVNKNDVLHFHVLGKDIDNVFLNITDWGVYIKITGSNERTRTENRNDVNCSGLNVSSEYLGNGDFLFKDANRKLALYRKTTQDIIFFVDENELKLNFYATEGGYNAQRTAEDALIVLCKTQIAKSQSYYEEDKFELTKAKINILLEDNNIENLLQLINEHTRFYLYGAFVGRESNNINDSPERIEADDRYLPLSNNLPIYTSQDRGRLLRYSTMRINENTIEIVSFVSPIISRLHIHISTLYYKTRTERFNAIDIANINLNQYTIRHYKVKSAGREIPSYNQLLACLRSWGFLEAVAKCLYIKSNYNETIKQRLHDILYNVNSNIIFSDYTAQSRGKNIETDIEKYNINVSNFSYEKYLSMKWYKDSADYDRYEHDIIF